MGCQWRRCPFLLVPCPRPVPPRSRLYFWAKIHPLWRVAKVPCLYLVQKDLSKKTQLTKATMILRIRCPFQLHSRSLTPLNLFTKKIQTKYRPNYSKGQQNIVRTIKKRPRKISSGLFKVLTKRRSTEVRLLWSPFLVCSCSFLFVNPDKNAPLTILRGLFIVLVDMNTICWCCNGDMFDIRFHKIYQAW